MAPEGGARFRRRPGFRVAPRVGQRQRAPRGFNGAGVKSGASLTERFFIVGFVTEAGAGGRGSGACGAGSQPGSPASAGQAGDEVDLEQGVLGQRSGLDG